MPFVPRTPLLTALAVATAATLAGCVSTPPAPPTLAPRVVVVTMFDAEAQPWLKGLTITRRMAVPGLSKAFPELACDERGVCVMTTSMGYANAATSMAALAAEPRLDLRRTYFIVSGIAGVDPADGTLGSVHWARWVVDGGLQNLVDARSMPSGWSTGWVGFGADAPASAPKTSYGTEVWRLDEALVQAAWRLTRDTPLADSDTARAYRARYPQPPANATPQVTICDTVSSDTWWHGRALSDAMNARARLLTDGAANYCTTQQEDNATLTALRRAADAGRVDFARVAVVRAASNFDQEAPGQSSFESLRARSGGFLPSVENAFRVASRLAMAIAGDWERWQSGPPAGQ